MRNTIIAAIAVLAPLISIAQKYDRAIMLQVGKYDESRRKWDWSKPEEVNLEFTLEGNLVKIDDEHGTKLWTYEDQGEESGYDKDGDKYTKRTWKAFDENNRKCMFVMLWYRDLSTVVYTVIYGDVAFRYYIDKPKQNRL